MTETIDSRPATVLAATPAGSSFERNGWSRSSQIARSVGR